MKNVEDERNWLEILKLSKEYKIEKLIEESKFKFSISLKTKDFYEVHDEYFVKQKMEELKDDLTRFAIENFDEIVNHPKFESIQKDLLISIIREKITWESLKMNKETKKLGEEIFESNFGEDKEDESSSSCIRVGSSSESDEENSENSNEDKEDESSCSSSED